MTELTASTKRAAAKSTAAEPVAAAKQDNDLDGPANAPALDGAGPVFTAVAPPPPTPAQLLRLQRTAGNQQVARLLSHASRVTRVSAAPGVAPEPVSPAPVAADPVRSPDPALERAAGTQSAPAPPVVMRSTVVQRSLLGSVLEKVAGWAKEIPGYHLMTLILGKDPISGAVVERNAMNVAHGILSIVPGGNKVFENLQQSGALERFFDWVSGEWGKLGLSFESIKQLFSQAWDALSVTDLLDPGDAWNKVKGIFGPPLGRIKDFAISAGKKVLEFILEGVLKLAGPLGEQVMAMLKKGGEVFNKIVEDPIGFLGNLLKAVKGGFEGFMGNILEHLKNGLMGWLFGALAGAGLTLPKTFDLKGILSIVLQVLGLTYQNLRGKLVAVLGAKTVEYIEKAVTFVKTLVTDGLAGAWKMIVEWIGNLQEMVIGAVQDWVVASVVKTAITKLVTMFNPVGAIIQGIITIYNTITFFIERAQQIATVASSIFESVGRIAAGDISGAAAYVEQTMAKAVPVVISFLASLIGLGGIGNTIRGIIEKIQAPISKALDKVVGFVASKAKAVWGKLTGKGEKKPGPDEDAAKSLEVKERAGKDLAGRLSGGVHSDTELQPILDQVYGTYAKDGLKSLDVKAVPNKPGLFDIFATASAPKSVYTFEAHLAAIDLPAELFDWKKPSTTLFATLNGDALGPGRFKSKGVHAEQNMISYVRTYTNDLTKSGQLKAGGAPNTIVVDINRSPCGAEDKDCAGALIAFKSDMLGKGIQLNIEINAATIYGKLGKQKESSIDAIKRLREAGMSVEPLNVIKLLEDIYGTDAVGLLTPDEKDTIIRRVKDLTKLLYKLDEAGSGAKTK